MTKQQVVLAVFPDEAAAERGVEALKSWDVLDKRIDFKAMGILALDEKGNVKQHKLGRRHTGTGAGIGFVLGTVAAATNPVGWGILGWTAVGAVAGHVAQKNLGLSEQDLDRLTVELDGGKAAVGVMANPDDAPLVRQRLQEFGGSAETYTLVEDDEVNAAAAKADARGPRAMGTFLD